MRGNHTVTLFSMSEEFMKTPFAEMTLIVLQMVPVQTRSQKRKSVASLKNLNANED